MNSHVHRYPVFYLDTFPFYSLYMGVQKWFVFVSAIHFHLQKYYFEHNNERGSLYYSTRKIFRHPYEQLIYINTTHHSLYGIPSAASASTSTILHFEQTKYYCVVIIKPWSIIDRSVVCFIDKKENPFHILQNNSKPKDNVLGLLSGKMLHTILIYLCSVSVYE